jgi:hypothetical protein
MKKPSFPKLASLRIFLLAGKKQLLTMALLAVNTSAMTFAKQS